MNRLRELRQEAHLTLRELADKVGIAYTALSRIENGQRSLNKEDIRILVKFFNVSSDYLLGISNERKPYVKQLQDHQVKILNNIKDLNEDQARDIINYIEFIKSKASKT